MPVAPLFAMMVSRMPSSLPSRAKPTAARMVRSALMVGEEPLAAVGAPAHRAADAARRPGGQKQFGMRQGARAEAATDIGADQFDLFGRNAEAFGQHSALAHSALAAGDDVIHAGRRIERREHCSRL